MSYYIIHEEEVESEMSENKLLKRSSSAAINDECLSVKILIIIIKIPYYYHYNIEPLLDVSRNIKQSRKPNRFKKRGSISSTE